MLFFELCHCLVSSLRCERSRLVLLVRQPILGDPGAVSGGGKKSKRARKKFGRRLFWVSEDDSNPTHKSNNSNNNKAIQACETSRRNMIALRARWLTSWDPSGTMGHYIDFLYKSLRFIFYIDRKCHLHPLASNLVETRLTV